MKSASTALKNFLLTTNSAMRADLYTFALPGGTVLRYTSFDRPITVGGHTFELGPIVSDGGVSCHRARPAGGQSSGISPSTVEITLAAYDTTTVGGVPFLDFVENFGLDGAAIKIERVWSATPQAMLTGGVGSYIRFSGRLAEIKELGASQVTIGAVSWVDLLSTNMPTDVFQTSCKNVLGDAKCGVDLGAYVASGAVTGTPTTTSFASGLTPTLNDYALGKVAFLTGPNAGQVRTIRSNDTSGNFVLAYPLPAPPTAGDTFHIFPGCDLSMTRCSGRFSNLIHFRGEPFIPTPSTGLPT